MSPQDFLASFHEIANAPGGVVRLRELIRGLAIRGQLVEHSADNVNAEDVRIAVEAERQALVENGLIRPTKKERSKNEPERPSWLPKHWATMPLGEIAVSVTDGDHLPPPKAPKGVPFLVISNVRWGGISFDDCRLVANDYFNKLDWIRKPVQGDLLFTLVGSFGIPVIVGDVQPFCVQRHIGIVKPSSAIDVGYLACALGSADLVQEVTKIATGTAQKTVPLSGLRMLPIPLPPLTEQKRIVAKVEELMALCDALEAQQQERDNLFPRLSRATHTRLTDTPTQPHLDSLFTDLGSISPADMRRTILTLAVTGHLVDGITHLEPETVGEHVEFLNGYAFKSEWFKSSGIKLCRNVNVSHGILDWRETVHVGEDIAEELKRYTLDEGDIVLSLDRPIITTGLKVARIRRVDLPCLLLQRVAKPIPKNELLEVDYFYLWLRSPGFIDSIDPGRSNGVPHISTKQVQKLTFRLPPADEQRRIVAKVNELMALVDTLEAQQQEKSRLAEAFAQACVASITGTTQLERTEKMKAPKTELVSFIKIPDNPNRCDFVTLSVLDKSLEALHAICRNMVAELISDRGPAELILQTMLSRFQSILSRLNERQALHHHFPTSSDIHLALRRFDKIVDTFSEGVVAPLSRRSNANKESLFVRLTTPMNQLIESNEEMRRVGDVLAAVIRECAALKLMIRETMPTGDKQDGRLALLLAEYGGTLPAKSLWQQSKLSIDEFYCQLRTELTAGWIAPPEEAQVLEVDASKGTAGFLRATGDYLKQWQIEPREMLETLEQLTEGNDQAAVPSQRTKRSKRK